ncbi:MAG: lytic transglycosylase domain-containing protein [Sulfuricaulis sp.]
MPITIQSYGLFIAVVCVVSALVTDRVQAGIYTFADATGVLYFTNVPSDPLYAGMTRVRYRYRMAPGYIAKSVSPSAYVSASKLYEPLVARAAREHQIDRALLQAVIAAESGYDRYAISRKGAVGLMQLTPETARRYGVRNLYDPAENIQGGAQYLRDLMRRFNNNLSLTLAAYNAGEDAIVRYGNRVPPYRETRQYVPRVMDLYQWYRINTR